MATNYPKKSAYGSRSSSYSKKPAPQGKGGGGDKEKPKTTHYAYMLPRDEEGNIVQGAEKEYVNDLHIYENEGKFGPYLAVNVSGPIPEGRIYIVRKKDA